MLLISHANRDKHDSLLQVTRAKPTFIIRESILCPRYATFWSKSFLKKLASIHPVNPKALMMSSDNFINVGDALYIHSDGHRYPGKAAKVTRVDANTASVSVLWFMQEGTKLVTSTTDTVLLLNNNVTRKDDVNRAGTWCFREESLGKAEPGFQRSTHLHDGGAGPSRPSKGAPGNGTEVAPVGRGKKRKAADEPPAGSREPPAGSREPHAQVMVVTAAELQRIVEQALEKRDIATAKQHQSATHAENARKETDNRCMYNTNIVQKNGVIVHCVSVGVADTPRAKTHKQNPPFLPAEHVRMLVDRHKGGEAAHLSTVYEHKVRITDSPVSHMCVCKPCAKAHHNAAECLVAFPSVLGGCEYNCPVCRTKMSSNTNTRFGIGGLCRPCVDQLETASTEAGNEDFVRKLLKRPLGTLLGMEVSINREVVIIGGQADGNSRLDYLVVFGKKTDPVAVVGLEVDANQHNGNRKSEEDLKNERNIAYMAREYPNAARLLIRFNPSGLHTVVGKDAVRRNEGGVATWKRFMDLRDWMGFFVLKRTAFPRSGSMLYMYYSEGVELFSGRSAAVGLACAGPRYAEDDEMLVLLPDWTCGPDPVIFGAKPAKVNEEDATRTLMSMDRRVSLPDVFGAGFGPNALLPWSTRQGTVVGPRRR